MNNFFRIMKNPCFCPQKFKLMCFLECPYFEIYDGIMNITIFGNAYFLC